MHQSPQRTFGVPSDNWASGHQKKQRDGTVWLPAMLVGALIFALGCGSGLLVGWFAGTGNTFGDYEPEPAAITIDAVVHGTVVAGEPFELIVTVTDTSGNQRTLQDIDFSGTVCDNMEFGSITPPPSTVDTNPGYREQSFNRALGANQSTEFIFEITPDQAGTYNNEITVYMEEYNSESTTVNIEVLPAT